MAVTPIFVFDSDEKWFPVGVDESLDATKPDLQTPTGAIPWPADLARLDKECSRLNFPNDMRPADLPPVGYHRVKEAAGLYWHQYWLWYLYNPWAIGGIGKHEGDWEFVQLGCTDEPGDHPVLMTNSQHHTGSKRESWAVSLEDGRPLVYVARGSHANYFAPLDSFEDSCDANGPRLADVTWREFGAWATWPGRWGSSLGEGKSPESPGLQAVRWSTPQLFHSSGR